jgi:hypothetical protein
MARRARTYPLKLPRSVKQAAAQLAKADGVSLNQFIASAVAEKAGSIKSAEIFLAERAGRAKCTDLPATMMGGTTDDGRDASQVGRERVPHQVHGVGEMKVWHVRRRKPSPVCGARPCT